MSSYRADFWQVRPPLITGGEWVSVKVEESQTADGLLTPLGTFTVDSWPADIHVANAQFPDGWFVLSFTDNAGDAARWPPMQRSDFPLGGPVFLYADVEDVRQALSPGGDPDDQGSAASLPDDDIQDAIEEAQSEVDAKVPGSRFEEGRVPPLVASVVRDVAAYLATLTHRRGEPMDPNDPVQKRYDRAQALLKGIQDGKIELGGEPDETSTDAWVENQYEGDMFTLAELGIGSDGGIRRTPWNWDMDGPVGGW